MTWSSRFRVESQNLSSHFESLVCQLESMSSQMKLNIAIIFFLNIFSFFCFMKKNEMKISFFSNEILFL